MDLVFAKREMMSRLCHAGQGKPTVSNILELKEPIETKASVPKKKKNKQA